MLKLAEKSLAFESLETLAGVFEMKLSELLKGID
jgi:hypothetical protein